MDWMDEPVQSQWPPHPQVAWTPARTSGERQKNLEYSGAAMVALEQVR